MSTKIRSIIQLLAIGLIPFMPIAKLGAQGVKDNQRKQVATQMKTIVLDSQHYVFVPQMAIPMGLGSRQLSYGYRLVISKTKIESYLPYFGRAYMVDYGENKSPLDFISTDFTYSIVNRKKGGWELRIEIKDVRDVRQLQLSIYENGSTTAQVICNNRQPISFSGNIEPVKPTKE